MIGVTITRIMNLLKIAGNRLTTEVDDQMTGDREPRIVPRTDEVVMRTTVMKISRTTELNVNVTVKNGTCPEMDDM